MPTPDCFSADDLLQWLEGASDRLVSDDPKQAAIAKHIRHCESCQALLEQACNLGEARLPTIAKQNAKMDSPNRMELISRWKQIIVESHHDTVALHTTPNKLQDSLSTLADGETIQHYTIVRELGRGGMSLVFEAIDRKLHRPVALKVLRGNVLASMELARLQREASAIAAIQHPNVVTIYEVQADPKITAPYLVMELVRGSTLDVQIRSDDGVLPFKTTARWIASVADGLSAAHAANIVHRDVKPSNILLAYPTASVGQVTGSEDRDSWIPKLADFGLAQTEQLDSHLTLSGCLTGTPAYASPEQAVADRVSTASDIYSLGVTLFESLTGELPFRGTSHAVVRQIIDNPFPSPRSFNPSIPLDLETICLKACQHDPSSRYRTASEFASDLRRWLAGEPIHAKPVTTIERWHSWMRRNRRVAALLFIVFGLLSTIALGSMASAIAMSRARKQIAVEASIAREAQEQAESASENAKEQSRIAEKQRQLAVDSLRSLIDEVQLKLVNRPGTLQIRKELLQVAFAGLDRLTKSDDESVLDHNRADAMIQLASIHSLLGNRKEANESIEKAIVAAESRLKESEDPMSMTDLAEAIFMKAEFATVMLAYAGTEQLYERAIELFERADKISVLNFKHRKFYIRSRQGRIDADMRAGRLSEAVAKFESLQTELDEIWDKYPERLDLRRLRCVGLNQLATAYSRMGDLAKYRDSLLKSLELTKSLLQLDPESYPLASDVTTLQSRLARQEREAGNWEEAVKQADGAVKSVLRYAAMDRSNLSAQSLVGIVYDTQYEALLYAGRLDEATEAAIHAFESHLATQKSSPGSLRYAMLAGESAIKVADTFVRRSEFDEASQWISKSLDCYDQAKDLPEVATSAWAQVRQMVGDYQTQFQFGCENYLRHPNEQDKGQQVVDLAFCAYIAARSGKSEATKNWIELAQSEVGQERADLAQRKIAVQLLIRALAVAIDFDRREGVPVEGQSYQDRACALLKMEWYPSAELQKWVKSEPETRRLAAQLEL